MGTKTKTFVVPVNCHYQTDAGTDQYRSKNVGLDWTRTGSSLKGYKNIIRNGGNATTAFSGLKRTMAATSQTAYAEVPKGRVGTDGQLVTKHESCVGVYNAPPDNLLAQPLSSAGADNQALTRFYQSIRQAKSSVQGLSVLGELGESLGTLRNVVRKLAERIPAHLRQQQKLIGRYLGSFQIGPNGSPVRTSTFEQRIKDLQTLGFSNKTKPNVTRPPKGKWLDLMRGLADNHLEFAFGVRPLIRDVHDTAEALARFRSDRPFRTVVRGYGQEEKLLSSSSTDHVQPSGFTMQGLAFDKLISRVEVIYRGALSFPVQIEGPGTRLREFNAIFGLTLEEFVPTVWNLLPYSFLVDYFINVGDCLMAMTTDTSMLQWFSRTQRNITEYSSATQAYLPVGVVGSGGGGFGGYVYQIQAVSRSAPAILQFPKIEVKVDPAFGQIANMVALLVSGKSHPRGY